MRAALLALVFIAAATAAAAQPSPEELCECIRDRLEQWGTRTVISVAGERIFATGELARFYEKRGYFPVWSDENGPTTAAAALLSLLDSAAADGLRPADYHRFRIETAVAENLEQIARGEHPDEQQLTDLDLLFTDAFFLYADHVAGGRVDRETIDPSWHVGDLEVDLVELLEGALESNSIEETLKSLLPRHSGYNALRRELERHRRMAVEGGWPLVPAGPLLRKGDQGPRVLELRRRLEASGDLPAAGAAAESFDDVIEAALLGFQRRHGIKPDGVLGGDTLTALNVPVDERVRQIEVNLERWRWLPRELGERYVLINIAAFGLEVLEEEKVVLAMKVITGRPYRKTPVFSDEITYLVFNPEWNVAPTIAKFDILPQVKKSVDYLMEKGYTVLRGWGRNEEVIDPATVDWRKVSAARLLYRFRQDPGPKNALGRVKFMFPNEYAVYLHDTPARALFDIHARAFSSGCIRVEKPIDLAEYLLGGGPEWGGEKVLEAIGSGETRSIRLPVPVPVYLLYWTAWVDREGSVHFRNDIYNRDGVLEEALYRLPPLL